jgi:hypothetical protein
MAYKAANSSQLVYWFQGGEHIMKLDSSTPKITTALDDVTAGSLPVVNLRTKTSSNSGATAPLAAKKPQLSVSAARDDRKHSALSTQYSVLSTQYSVLRPNFNLC